VLIQHWDRIAGGDMIVYFVDECHVLGLNNHDIVCGFWVDF